MALANARTFGGEDYVGFHTMMAIAPAVYMSGELPASTRALPILKVMFRNATRIQERGGRAEEVLRPVTAAPLPAGQTGSEALRDSVRRADMEESEGRFVNLAANSADEALNNLIATVGEGVDVHRVVLPYRCWDLLGIIGQEHAHTLLRQSVRFCVRCETPRMQQYYAEPRAMLPRMLDQHRLEGRQFGNRIPDDAWIERLSETIFRGTPDQAADAVGAALAEGMNPDSIGEAISLAVNQLVLRDSGRRENEVQPNKPVGSVHGDSIGVHACDSANAWRRLARVSNPRNKAICLVLGGWQAARDRTAPAANSSIGSPIHAKMRSRSVENVDRDSVMPALHEAIRGRDQARSCACQSLLGIGIAGSASLVGYARLRVQRRWRLALREILPNDHGRIHCGASCLPPAATPRFGACHRQRLWICRPWPCRGTKAFGDVTWISTVGRVCDPSVLRNRTGHRSVLYSLTARQSLFRSTFRLFEACSPRETHARRPFRQAGIRARSARQAFSPRAND